MSYYQLKIDIKDSTTTGGKYLTPFQRKILQKSLEKNLSDSYRQRIEIMLLADEGKSQTKICQTLGCCAATARHWIHIARTGMAHQWQDCPIGRPKAVNEEYLERLRELITNSPRDYGYAFRRWTATWLQKHLAKEFGVEVSDRHIKRLLKQMGLSTRPQPSNATENSIEQAKDAKILIADLTATISDNSDNSEFLPLNLAK
ncbi:transposase [Nostoc minutum NIES-26]|uniref:Transposase n=1 Tax=Nostoc minutum NIES-26 TaxID=1844469 RepID=A0A367R6S7_9NOSO|nr:transposase [Nostoc minutum NIES-26]